MESAVGGWWRVCSGGLKLGSGRDRLLAHPISLWTTVSMIGAPVAVRVGGGGLHCMEGSSEMGFARGSAHRSSIKEVK